MDRPALVLGVLSASILLDALDRSRRSRGRVTQRELVLPVATLWVGTPADVS